MEKERMMTISILAFGIAKDILGARQLKLELPENETVAGLKDRLLERYPDFSRLRSLRFAVNQEYRDNNYQLHPSDEVAIIPPVSGG